MPQDEYLKNEAMSFAAGRFEKGLLCGLSKIYNVHINTISIEPQVGKFPKGKLFVKGKKLDLSDIRWNSISVGYINLPFIKQMCIFCFIGVRLIYWNIKFAKEKKVVITYNIDVPLIQIGLFAQKMGIIYLPIIADLPFYYEIKKNKFTIEEMLSLIGYRSQLKNLTKIYRAMILNENVSIDFNLKNWILIDGAITEDEIQKYDVNNKNEISDRRTVIYCGSLDIFHGSDKLLELVVRCKNINFIICGRGKKWAQKFIEASKEFKNLKFYGAVDDQELRHLHEQADLLLIPHPINYKQLRYQFPSKLMTCMASGIPVITTPLPGITSEYSKYIQITDDDSVVCIESAIEKFFSEPEQIRKMKGEKARVFVLQNKTWLVQADKIVKYLLKESI